VMAACQVLASMVRLDSQGNAADVDVLLSLARRVGGASYSKDG